MVIDSSALIALPLAEPETEGLVAAIAAGSNRVVSASTYVETAIVMIARSGPEDQEKLDQLLAELAIAVARFTHEQADLAVIAYRQYGRGSGHPAGLNFGDWFTYALTKSTSEPVLFKGDDFGRTDLQIAL